MWSSSKDTNEHGESILLLLPIDKNQGNNNKRRNKNKRSTNPSSSHIGGLPFYHENDDTLPSIIRNDTSITNPKCASCDNPMYLLLQLHAPLDDFNRTLYVFGCNNAVCHSRKSEEGGDNVNVNRFRASYIGNKTGGALCCIRSQQQWNTSSKKPLMSSTTDDSENPKESPGTTHLESNDWGIEDDGSEGWGGDNDGDSWGNCEADNTKNGDTNISMDDLESMLTNCEMHSASTKKSEVLPSSNVQSSTKASTINKDTNGEISAHDVPPSFEYHDLEMVNEPPTKRGVEDDSDEEDELNSNDASKVNQMLSQYLGMEDDEEILSALKGGGKSNGDNDGKGGGGGERYERLPPEERAFLAFSKRLKRAPEQVARYAYEGVPMWAVPLPPSGTRSKQQQKSKKKSQPKVSPLPPVPNCDCGAERVFEFQVLPSLLHALDVDSYTIAGSKESSDDDVMDLISAGGMNWGSIAVYSCPRSCDESREEVVIIQEAIGDSPIRKDLGTSNGGNSDNDMDDN